MEARLFTPEEAKHYKEITEQYVPSRETIFAFADSSFAVIAGPTGAGKDTVRNELLSRSSDFVRILSTTSRPPRPHEKDGIDYHFRALEYFDDGLEEHRFLQAAVVHNQQISCLDIKDINQLHSYQIGLSILIVQTEIQLRVLNPELKTVFLIPPDTKTLLERMQADRELSPEELSRRTDAAKSELDIALSQSGYACIINDDLQRACDQTEKFVREGLRDEEENNRARSVVRTILNELIEIRG